MERKAKVRINKKRFEKIYQQSTGPVLEEFLIVIKDKLSQNATH